MGWRSEWATPAGGLEPVAPAGLPRRRCSTLGAYITQNVEHLYPLRRRRSPARAGAPLTSSAPNALHPAASMPAVTTVADLPLVAAGKVREMYDLGDRLLMVASDRISTYDVVHPTPIPEKGAVLTGLSTFWFELTGEEVPNHFLSVTNGVPADVRGRAMVVRKLRMVPLECVVRGYITGSGWKDYQQDGTVSGIRLPDALRESEQLPEPIFTPSTKAEVGHDETVDAARAAELVGGADLLDELRVGDEVLTPDSSRFWPADGYEPGRPQPSFDKQYVRDWAAGTGWDKAPPAPPIPEDVVARTREKYVQAYERIAGEPFSAWLARTAP